MVKPVGKSTVIQRGKGSELSVTEMMQWLDSKLGQSAPVQRQAHSATG